MPLCEHCGKCKTHYTVTHAMGGWGVERCCDQCGPLETLWRGFLTKEDAEEELFSMVSVETGRSREDLRRLYRQKMAERTKRGVERMLDAVRKD